MFVFVEIWSYIYILKKIHGFEEISGMVVNMYNWNQIFPKNHAVYHRIVISVLPFHMVVLGSNPLLWGFFFSFPTYSPIQAGMWIQMKGDIVHILSEGHLDQSTLRVRDWTSGSHEKLTSRKYPSNSCPWWKLETGMPPKSSWEEIQPRG